jgi:hypothetical protein
MESTLTIRLDKQQREALRKRARTSSKSESEVARELLAAGLKQSSHWDDISHLKGCVRLPKAGSDAWRKQLRERNWRA